MSNEVQCKWVSSRGILKSCNRRNRVPQSSNRHIDADILDGVSAGDTVYICSWLTITRFVKEFIQKLSVPIIVVSGDSDMDAPIFEKPVGPGDEIAKEEILAFINSDLCIHWYTQNCTLDHPKVTPIPIGMDYHTYGTAEQDDQIITRLSMMPEEQRELLCYGNFHFNMHGKYYTQERLDCYSKVPKELCYYEPSYVDRYSTWTRQRKYNFVLCPAGGGLDCHRTWEALILGCIPVLKRTGHPHDRLFDNLPVVFIDDWSDVTEELLLEKVREINIIRAAGGYAMEKLTLAYWNKVIRSITSCAEK